MRYYLAVTFLLLFFETVVSNPLPVFNKDELNDSDLTSFLTMFFNQDNRQDYDVPPTIESVTLSPVVPFAGYPLQLEVVTSDNANSAFVMFSTDDGNNWIYITLTAQGEELWTCSLGTFSANTAVIFYLTILDEIGQRTIEAYPVSGWLPNNNEWTLVSQDPNDVGISDLDLFGCYTGYDAEYFYARLKVQGEISDGSLWPPWEAQINIYVAGIKNVSTNEQFGLTYIPLADDIPSYGEEHVIALRSEPNGDIVPETNAEYEEDDDELYMRCLFEPIGDNPDGYYRLKYATAYANLNLDVEQIDSTFYCHFYPRNHSFTTVENQPPLAEPGSDQTVSRGDFVQLDGSGSYDPDEGPLPLTYNWQQTSGQPVTLDDANSASPTFQAPQTPAEISFQLMVYDGLSNSDPAYITIYITNSPPVFAEIPAQIFNEDSYIDLDLEQFINDLDDPLDSMTVVWQEDELIQVVELQNLVYRFYTWQENLFGQTQLLCTVTDPYDASASTDIEVTVNPINDSPTVLPLPLIVFEEDTQYQFDLDDYVIDVDNLVEDLIWQWEWVNSKNMKNNKKPQRQTREIRIDNIFVEIDTVSHLTTVWAETDWFGGPEDIRFIVSDDSLAIDEGQTTVTVLSVNDPPEFVNLPDSLWFAADSTLCLALNEYISDVDTPLDEIEWNFSGLQSINRSFDEEEALLCLWINQNVDLTEILTICAVDGVIETCTDVIVTVEMLLKNETEVSNFNNKLFPAQPNPFRQFTNIQYNLAKETAVSISIYDLNGRKIKMLLNRKQSVGQHTVRWDGQNSKGQLVANGVYFYRIFTPEWQATQKLVRVN